MFRHRPFFVCVRSCRLARSVGSGHGLDEVQHFLPQGFVGDLVIGPNQIECFFSGQQVLLVRHGLCGGGWRNGGRWGRGRTKRLACFGKSCGGYAGGRVEHIIKKEADRHVQRSCNIVQPGSPNLLVPRSYFWICWKVTPSASPSFSCDSPSNVLRSRIRLPTWASIVSACVDIVEAGSVKGSVLLTTGFFPAAVKAGTR